MKKIRVVMWGFGAMGSGMVNLMLQKKGIEVVGVIDQRPELVGKDIGDVLKLGKKVGITVTDKPETVLQKGKVDVCLQAIHSFTKIVFPYLKQALEAGINVISIAEEMSCPSAQEPELAKQLDEIARKNNVTLLGTGINPGFILDQMVVNLTGVCLNVEHIEASRINDLSPFGKTVMETQGVGTTPEEFKKGIEDGSIVGHIGFPESVMMISDALGLGVDRIEQTREPIISKTHRETPVVKVEPGMVAGCRHIATAYRGDKEVIKLIHPQQIHPEAEKVDTGDYIKIKGDPDISLAIKPEVPGGKGTMAMAVNMIPLVVKASPGLKRMTDMPIPACLMGDKAYERGA